jgi:hypothetical protein
MRLAAQGREQRWCSSEQDIRIVLRSPTKKTYVHSLLAPLPIPAYGPLSGHLICLWMTFYAAEQHKCQAILCIAQSGHLNGPINALRFLGDIDLGRAKPVTSHVGRFALTGILRAWQWISLRDDASGQFSPKSFAFSLGWAEASRVRKRASASLSRRQRLTSTVSGPPLWPATSAAAAS